MSAIVEINQLAMSGLYVIYGNAGAIYEKPGEYGTSHLMEHLVAHTWDDMRDMFQENAISSNAYTASDVVVFHITGLTSRVEPVAKDFVNKVVGGIDSVTEEKFDNEKQTVLQEYGDTFSDPMAAALNSGLRKVYGTYGPIGERSCVEKFSFDDMKRVYAEKFARPSMIVYIGPSGVNFPGIEYTPSVPEATCLPEYSENRQIELEPFPGIDRVMVNCFSKKICDAGDSMALKIACRMLSGGLNSPLYQEIREKRGLSYYSVGDVERCGSVVVPMFFSATEKERAGELIGVYDQVFGDLDRYMTRERFDICMNFAKINREKNMVLRYEYYEDFIVKELGYALDENDLDTLTYERVMEIAHKYLSLDNICKYTA